MDQIIIDVREPFEYASGHVKGAINIPPMKLMRGLPKELADVPKDTQIILYCLLDQDRVSQLTSSSSTVSSMSSMA